MTPTLLPPTPQPTGQPPGWSAATRRARPRVSAAELRQRSVYAVLCLGLHLLVLAACAKMGALRVPDLVATMATLGVAYALAIRDSKHLSVFVIGVWVFSRLVRRLIDWRLGGFESLTALSLLPMMATLTLLIPLIPRWKRISAGVRQSVLLMVLPIGVATVIGLARFGSSAVIDAGGWLTPMLFVPYYASRPTSVQERWQALRLLVLMAAAVAAYGWFQFVLLPPWDAMWLSQSGMISSMGQAQAGSFRVWGTLSSTGPAAGFWASALGLMMCGVRPPPSRGLLHGALIGSALLLSRVRVCWLSPLVGLVVYAAIRGRKGSSEAVGLGLAAAAIVGVVMLLPGGDLVSKRLESFGNLSQDQSFRSRSEFAGIVVDLVSEHPFGGGIGFGSVAKISGASTSLAAFDNGFGAVVFSLGLPGALLWGVGVATLAQQLLNATRRGDPGSRGLATAGLVQLAMSFASLASAFFMAGELGVLMWLTVGMALAPDSLAVSFDSSQFRQLNPQ